MKKINLLAALLLLTNWGYSQWITRNVDNGIDQPYRIAYSEDKKNHGLLKLEYSENTVAVYVTGGYHCSDNPVVDLAFKVNGQFKRHTINAQKSKDSKTVFLVFDITASDQKDFLNDFLVATSVVMRINEESCTDDYYSFDMTNSARAFNFIKNQ
jgi:hypothetical protein